MSIPIVDEHRHIVGWTDTTPEIRGATLRQADAERLLGPAVRVVYVSIEDHPDDARRAGAPLGWQGRWRCLALCSSRMPATPAGDPILIVTRPPQAKAP